MPGRRDTRIKVFQKARKNLRHVLIYLSLLHLAFSKSTELRCEKEDKEGERVLVLKALGNFMPGRRNARIKVFQKPGKNLWNVLI